MEKTGSTDRILQLIDQYNVNKISKEKTKESITENRIFKQFTIELENINSSKNIAEILVAECAMLKY